MSEHAAAGHEPQQVHVVMTLGKSPGVVTTALKALSCMQYQDPEHEIYLPVHVVKLHLICIPNESPPTLPEPLPLFLPEPLDVGWRRVLDQSQGVLRRYWPFGTRDYDGEIADRLGNAEAHLDLPTSGMETDTVKIWCLATGETDLVEAEDTVRFGELCDYVLREVLGEVGNDASRVWVGLAGGRKHMASILHTKAAAFGHPFRMFHVVLTDDCEKEIRDARTAAARDSGFDCPEEWDGLVDIEMQPPLSGIRLVVIDRRGGVSPVVPARSLS